MIVKGITYVITRCDPAIRCDPVIRVTGMAHLHIEEIMGKVSSSGLPRASRKKR